MGVYDVARNQESSERFWDNFYGPNFGYIEEQYELYKRAPEDVEPSIKEKFDRYGAPKWLSQDETISTTDQSGPSFNDVKKLTSAMNYVEAVRRYGHLEADIYPVGNQEDEAKLLSLDTYGLSEQDLQNMPAAWLWDRAPQGIETGLEVVDYLLDRYTGKISFEYDHVNSDDERKWLLQQIESDQFNLTLSDERKQQLLERLAHIEGFENFLQKTFVGQKRFSIEGLEMMVPILDELVKHVTTDNIDNIMMGMAHRGRLSVLAHVLGKPYDRIFSEFHHSPDKELIPSEGSTGINYGWTGDVKYHFGATKEVTYGEKGATRITLAHNPSHLEFVNPVVEGFARAAQDNRKQPGYAEQDVNKGCAVLIHGDAAFIGEGVVAETLNMSGLEGYKTGGTLHIIANNLIGYTTTQSEGRSTRYASDLAKGFEIPIVHVNADDPAACIAAVKLAYEYRRKFNKDFLIDLVGYRRYGHNEMDEPRATQPLLYEEIDSHPTITEVFAKQLQDDEIIDENKLPELRKKVEDHLQSIYDSMKEDSVKGLEIKEMPKVLSNKIDDYDTTVPLDDLKALNADMLKRPDGFKGFKRLSRIYKRRENVLDGDHKADWGTGEALAYASILKDGIPIRLTGQDSERGTFAHRHMVLHDVETAEKYCIMHGLDDAKTSFDIYNSPLSEAAVLGFEYGYSVHSPNTLVLWEAQFGDFANAAQVIFDQFISSSRAKWGEKSNMVILLPHGYEGQGPEHSSARLERFLQMAAENNWIVANVTSSAQFFHLIRRQAAMRGKEVARPLVLMTPKSSLLRNDRMASKANEFTDGKFQLLREQPNHDVQEKKVKRLLLGSGKVMIDIEEAIENSEDNFDWLQILRIEQIYPFPQEALKHAIDKLPHLEEVVWLQEEPKNMGSWNFVESYIREIVKDGQALRYIGRQGRSSPAVGEPNVHKGLQNHIIAQAIKPLERGKTSEGN